MSELTTMVIDDHELIRQGLTDLLGREADITVLGGAGSVAEAMEVFAATRPKTVVTDLQLPDGTGLDIVRQIRAQSADTGIVIVSMHTGDEPVLAAMDAGASGYIGKDAPAAEVVHALRYAAAAPGSFASPYLARAVAQRQARESTRLSEREAEVLAALAEGLTAAEIGERLYVSSSTVKGHLERIYQKLGVNNRTQAVAAALRSGLLSEDLA